MNLIVLAIPVFFLLILVELVVARVQERDLYALSDTVNDLSCGIVDQLLAVAGKTILFAGYIGVFSTHRVAEVPMTSVLGWTACFLGYDFVYYWFHRLSHEMNVFWAAHVVHHQSEEYNLAVALRQGALQQWFSWVFYLPLALLGFPPAMFLTVSSIDTIYQFWIHTRVIDKLGPLDSVLNTPANHRVHHARNPKYIDRNHGGILIIWDRLFGTYEPEGVEPVFGIVTPLKSWNPLWANVSYWADIVGKARRTTQPFDKLRMFLKPPGWQPEDLGGFLEPPEIDPAQVRKFEVEVPAGVKVYALVQFLATVAVASVFLFQHETWPFSARLAVGGFVLASVVSLGALLERRRWGVPFEIARLVTAVTLLVATRF